MQLFRSSSALAAALSTASLTSPLKAQEVLEEISVTTLRRAESLQDAPATVTAFDAETIEQARIQSMREYVNLTSNMTLMETQNAFAFVNIRGLAQVYWEPENFIARDPLTLVDLRFGITAARGWEAVVWVDNAADEDWISEESNPNGIVYYGRPQQYGLEVTYRS